MKNSSAKIVAFIASLGVGFIIVINMKLSNLPVNKQLSTIEYKEAIDERNKLYSELEILQKENDSIEGKIDSYTGYEEKDEKIINDMLSQLNDYGMLTGSSPVKGPGVVIKIKDGDYDVNKETRYETSSKVFHDNDAIMVLNEIRLAGGEAVALNDHRIIPSTGLECSWAFIRFENDQITPGPSFYYYVIGDPEKLESILTKEDSYINKLIRRGLEVEINVKEEIILESTSQNMDVDFMKQVDSKEK